jgi:hypothetical protein
MLLLLHDSQSHFNGRLICFSQPSEQVAIALYGFVIAATWIDLIANQLVSLLQFLGVILRIPNYIMGLTVLAWGNSMADLSAVSPSTYRLLDKKILLMLSTSVLSSFPLFQHLERYHGAKGVC